MNDLTVLEKLSVNFKPGTIDDWSDNAKRNAEIAIMRNLVRENM